MNRPWAERQQPLTDESDVVLVGLARRNAPQCSWWWGRGRFKSQRRITCYVCNQPITEAAPAHVLPRGAIEAVMEHRATELERNRVRLVNP